MTWIHYCLITILLYGIHDIMLKHLADSVHSAVASFAINASAAVVLFFYLWLSPAVKWSHVPPVFSRQSALLSVAGVALGVATITFMNAFGKGGSLSVAVPVVYAGVIGICMLIGVWLFEETLNWRQMLGALLAVVGIFLMSKSGA
jgi:drug/metabolite transporter (DMT)-like permease